MNLTALINFFRKLLSLGHWKPAGYWEQKRLMRLSQYMRDGIVPFVDFVAENEHSLRLQDLITLGYIRRKVFINGPSVEILWVYEGSVPVEMDFKSFHKQILPGDFVFKIVRPKGKVSKEDMSLEFHMAKRMQKK